MKPQSPKTPRSAIWIWCFSGFWMLGFGVLLLGCDKKPPGSAPAAAKAKLVPLTNMVLIKAGTFIRQNHPITISRDFWLCRYEVTQGEYEMLMTNNPSHFKGDTNRPVERVKCYDAVAYCSVLTKRESTI